MTARSSTFVVLAMLLVSLIAAAVDVLAAPVAPPPLEAVEQEPARAGTWYCPATGGDGDQAVISVAAVGEQDSTITVVRFAAEGPVEGEPTAVAAGDTYELGLESGTSSEPLAVRWSGGPVAASLRLIGPTGMAAAPCADGPEQSWMLTGLDTAEGSSAILHLLNPYPSDAVVRVVFATPDGRVDLILTDSVLVPAEQSVRLDLGEFEPERADLGVLVQVRTGRVIVAGESRFDPPGEQTGPTGRILMPAVPGPDLEWAFADARQSDSVDSHLSVMNPADREAAVEVRVSDPLPEGGALLDEVSVPAGGVIRLPLGETSSATEFGVTVTVVNEVPVVAALVSDVRTDAGRAMTAATGAARPETEWALVGAGTVERSSVLSVYNPGAELATVSLSAPGAPPDWQGVAVPPNAQVAFDLGQTTDPDEAAAFAVLVSADAPVVPQLRVSDPAAGYREWTAIGIPSQAWTGPELRPAVLHDPTLSSRPVTAEGVPGAGDVVDPVEPPLAPIPVDPTELEDAQPGMTEPGTTEPGTTEAGTTEAGTAEPGATEPEAP